MADKTFIPESCVITKSHGKTQFYDRNGNIASLPNKQVKVFDDKTEEGGEEGWNHFQAGGGSGEPEGDAGAGVDPEGAAEIEQTLDEGGDPGSEGDAVLDALDRANDAEAEVSDESGEVAAAAPATKSKSKRGSGKSGGKTMATAKAKAAAPKKAAVKKAGKTTVVAQPKKVNGQGTGLLRSIKGRVHDISGYVKSKNASGHVSYDNGDDVAEKLRGKDLDQVYDLVAKAVKEDVKALRAKYKHLNVGMQRMSLGNRLRKVNRAKAEKAAASA